MASYSSGASEIPLWRFGDSDFFLAMHGFWVHMHDLSSISCMTCKISCINIPAMTSRSANKLPKPTGYGAVVAQARGGRRPVDVATELGIDSSALSKIESESIVISREMYLKLITGLRTLKPAELLNVMGWPVTVAGADKLPHPLIRDLLALDQAGLEVVASIAHELASRPIPRRPGGSASAPSSSNTFRTAWYTPERRLPAVIGAHDMRHTSASHSVGQMSESAMMTLVRLV